MPPVPGEGQVPSPSTKSPAARRLSTALASTLVSTFSSVAVMGAHHGHGASAAASFHVRRRTLSRGHTAQSRPVASYPPRPPRGTPPGVTAHDVDGTYRRYAAETTSLPALSSSRATVYLFADLAGSTSQDKYAEIVSGPPSPIQQRRPSSKSFSARNAASPHPAHASAQAPSPARLPLASGPHADTYDTIECQKYCDAAPGSTAFPLLYERKTCPRLRRGLHRSGLHGRHQASASSEPPAVSAATTTTAASSIAAPVRARPLRQPCQARRGPSIRAPLNGARQGSRTPGFDSLTRGASDPWLSAAVESGAATDGLITIIPNAEGM
ncbi:hypothetical protein LTR53_009491 [Teratosphaeriaceae sp. CCFEE 6253]|nr:hypothetical protein LTR53_009491 [Teratosphaeriaceae sp. CCFEE 6253]